MKDEDDYRDYDEGDGKAVSVALTVTMVLLLLICVGIAMLLSGCKATEYVPVETVRTEYRDRIDKQIETDTIVDTRFVFVKGDTVVDYREKERIRRVEIHDTCFVERIVKEQVPYPVERKLSRWEQAKMDFGGMAIGGLAFALCIAVLWLARKFRK